MILVTGGTGLIGSHLLLDLVREGEQVKALKRPNSDLRIIKKVFHHYADNAEELLDKIQWVDGDILDVYSLLDAVEGVDAMVHSAAYVTLNPAERDKLFKINVEGTANCVNAAIEKGVKRFCHVSSVSAVGRDKKAEVKTEDTKWVDNGNATVYAQSKYMAEREAWRGSVEGLDMVIVNPSTVIGLGDWDRSSTRLIKRVWDGLKFYTTGKNGFVDARDVSKAIVQLLKSNIKNERFIVTSENVAFRDLLWWMADDLGKPRPSVKAKKFLSEIYWRLEWVKGKLTGTDPLITKDASRTANYISLFSNEKLKKAIDIEFIPIRQSVKEACAAFLEEHQN